ncbi:MAG: glycosyltransferase family 9 protein [Chloroherpetonaceae bacterium]|nr:glycosyltransferase family 9 protein [Chthonomonadaceae bacterium]MDW8207346.1 glycosyltransferase family 9 protein [Chloroherpetonaceae bacterium]
MSDSASRAINMTGVRRVLIVKLSAFGDIVHALPVSAALGTAFPHREIIWAVEEPFVDLLSGNPYVQEIFPLPKLKPGRLMSATYRRTYLSRLGALRRLGCDLAIDLQGLTKSAIVSVASGAKIRIGYHWLREIAPLLERRVPRRPQSVHIVDQYLDVARYLGADLPEVIFPFHIPAEAATSVNAMLEEAGIGPHTPFIAINPASARANKQWGVDRYAALIDRCQHDLRLPCVLVTADRKVAEAVQDRLATACVNLAGRTDLKQLAAVLSRCAVHVCGDTGSAHLAAALGRPVVMLIGPTDPDRIGPYNQRHNVITHREVCAPGCTWHRCRYEPPRCLSAIHVTEVLAGIQANLTTGSAQDTLSGVHRAQQRRQ